MSTPTTTQRAGTPGTPGTPPAPGPFRAGRLSPQRIGALGRAELTLLLRNRTALVMAVLVPIMLTFSIRSAAQQADLSGTGLSVATTVLPGSVGMVLLFAVYSNLIGVYVARREELVLKRLRTGEATDAEILGACALPAVVIGVAQCVLLLGGGAVVLDAGAPARPDLLVVSVLLGLALSAVLAAASTAVTKSSEMAQLTPMPLMLVTFAGSGVFVPLEVFPDKLAAVCEWLPLTPVMELLRSAWTEQLSGAGTLRALGIALAWIALSWFLVRRYFRWEPRR
ncbi:ABC transporter permease [Streptomyces cacaoi]|uniref:ABC transporter permease n=1 Tax=Streptomyces cacaoi TaxID=1898 RepID=UPI00331B6C9E